MSMVPKTARPTRQVRPTMRALAVADGGDAVQRALDAGAVVVAKFPNPPDSKRQIVSRDHLLTENDVALWKASRWNPPEIEDNLEQIRALVKAVYRLDNTRGERGEKGTEVIGDDFWHSVSFPP